MSKGNIQWSFQKGFEDAFLEQKKSEWVEKKVPTSKEGTKKKKDYWDIIMEIRSELSFVDTSHIWESRVCQQSNSEIYDIMTKKLEENKIRAADYELKRWLHTIVREYDRNLKKSVLKSLDTV